jgi:hypothetical protein
MSALTHCKAMEAFCRQRAKIESEVEGFWLAEADLWHDRILARSTKSVVKNAKPTAGHPRARETTIPEQTRRGAQ